RERSDVLKRLGFAAKSYHLATIHRAENTDDVGRLKTLLEALARLDRPVVIPLHPRTRAALEGAAGVPATGTLRIIEPLGYLDMLALMEAADAVLTDSGGLQKEAYWLGVRCVTLREETEWTETLAGGWNQLTGATEARIRAAVGQRP